MARDYENQFKSKSQELYKRINELRQKMIEYGELYGLNNPFTVKVSQELDVLLNQAQSIPNK